jgi:hypothetical protein
MQPKDSLPYLQDPDTGPYLNQMNLVHRLTPYLFKMNFNIIFQSTRFFPSIFPTNFYAFLISRACYMLCPSYSPWFDHPNKIKI